MYRGYRTHRPYRQFDEVPVSTPPETHLRRARRSIADQLASLVESGEVDETTTVAAAIALLRG